jgi:putative lipoic acid-binding regulatory protein
MDQAQTIELLNATHAFPCPFSLKVIGKASDDFVTRIVAVVQSQLRGEEITFDYSTRTTPGGRHVSVTMEPILESAEHVLRIYGEIQTVEGVIMTM